jgi:DNA-binding response OmpR family regulator
VPKKMLIVDDDPLVVRMLKMTFDLEGYDVATAFDGEEGLARAREFMPDVILCDIMMPKLDGLAVTRALKADAATKGIPIVLCSAKTSDADVKAGKEAGADDYVTKPFQVKALAARVAGLLA